MRALSPLHATTACLWFGYGAKHRKSTKVRNCGHVHRSSVSGHLHRCRAVARVQTAAPNTLKRASVSTVGQIGCLVQQVRVYTARALELSPAAPTFCVHHSSPNVTIGSLAMRLGAAGESVYRAHPWLRVWSVNRPEAPNKCSGTPTAPLPRAAGQRKGFGEA